jgi:hypothetical protein
MKKKQKETERKQNDRRTLKRGEAQLEVSI